MIHHKLTEIGAICTIGVGYCAREYEIITPATFNLMISGVSIVGAILIWSIFFEPDRTHLKGPK